MGQELVTIKPKPNSRSFASVGTMVNVLTQVDDKGNVITQKQSEFLGQRFPKSKQMFRIPWNTSKRRWMLQGFEEANTSEMQALVKRCKLQYESPSKRAGEYIENADIFDYNDAFFNHRLCKIIANEGEFLIDKADPLHNLILRGLKKHPRFQIAGEDNPVMSSGARYVIVDREIDIKLRKASRNNKMKVMKLFDSLTTEKKHKIALAMGLVSNDYIDADVIDDILFKAAEDSTGKNNDYNITRQDLFIRLCEMDSEELNVKHRIVKAKASGILKKQADGWILFGYPVGKSTAQIEEFLKNPDNNQILTRLETALNDKSNKTSRGVSEASESEK